MISRFNLFINTTFLTLFVLTVFVFTSFVFAQSDQEEIAQKYGITFPIVELGNCQDLDACKSYCDDIAYKDVCISYAQEKGFYQESQQMENPASAKSDEEILKLAKVELGCDSYDACMKFCDQEGNWSRCEEFAYKHGLGGEEMKKMREVMDKLGCSTPSFCMSFCSNPDNMTKCMETFQSVGFDTGIANISLEECQKLNPSLQCKIEGSICTCSEPPEVWCGKVGGAGETCTWDGNQCTCWNPKECESYPGCKFTGKSCECSQSQEDSDNWCAKQPGCSWNGSTCNCTGGSSESPEVSCSKSGSYCKWNGNVCDCSEPPEVWCGKTPGCSWNGSTCDCSGQISPLREQLMQECLQKANCSWDEANHSCNCQEAYPTPTYCPPDQDYGEDGRCISPSTTSGVQGATTSLGLLEKIWYWISQMF